MAEKNIVKNAFYSFIKAFLTLIFPLITFPYASRILLPEGIGKVNFALSTVTYFTLLSTLGIVNYGTREASKIRNNRFELSKFSKEILTINLFSTLISVILFFIMIFTVPKMKNYRSLLILFSLHIFLTTLSMDWLYNALEEFKYVTIRSFIFQCIALIYLFLFVKTKDDVNNYAVFGLISSVGSYICNFIHSRKYIDLRVKCRLDIKKHLKYVFTFFGMSVVTSLYSILDTTMLGFLSNDTQVGYYSAGIKLNKMSVGLVSACLTVLLPRLSIYKNDNDKKNYNDLIHKSLQLIILISIPMIAGLLVLSEPLVVLLSGKDFFPAVKVMKIITPIVFAMSIGYLTGTQILPSMEKEKIALISYICGAVSNLTLNSLLIPEYGAVGAALATVFAETLVTLVQVIYLRKMIFYKETFVTIIQSLIASILMFAALYFFIKITSNIYIQVFVSILIGVLLYFCLIILMHNKLAIEVTKKLKDKIIKNKK